MKKADLDFGKLNLLDDDDNNTLKESEKEELFDIFQETHAV